MKIFSKTEKKGSALLVVLGFLTFMMISAVSFSIYMRTERQASSNYKHSITARHLLESALYRAIDEVDADLREAPDKKFPNHWEGRVFTSKSNTPEVEDARVLSLEALSFIPASLVNDVRYFSISTPDEPKFGTKWRRMSMPIESPVDIENNRARSSGGKSYVGRYAYTCVNLSDMLNINGCTNMVRSVSNLVSVAGLFSTPAIAENFSKQAGLDIHYATLQDFYACMAVAALPRNNNYFGGLSDSPYIQFLRDGKNSDFNDTYNHLFVADGFAKQPPVRKGACNVTLNPPFAPGGLKTKIDPFNASLNPNFYAKIKELFPDAARPGSPFAATLADYLAPDSVPTMRLDAPSSKLTPMICQVKLASPFTPVIRATDVNVGTPSHATEYKLHLVQNPGVVKDGLGLQVRVCYPFKDISPRIRGNLVLSVWGFLRVDKQCAEPNMTSKIVQKDTDIKFIASADVSRPDIKSGNSTADVQQNQCYKWIPLPIDIPDKEGIIKTAVRKKSDGQLTAEPGFNPNGNLNVSLVITKATIHEGLIADYDMVPAYPPGPLQDDDPKLYFQTDPVNIAPGMAALPDGSQGCLVPYAWDSLETPDPRFNHYVVNWWNNSSDPNRGGLMPHEITKSLLGEDGRDADIFMACSGAETLQSVGELGFIIRPYKYDMLKGKKQVNFREKKYVGKGSLNSNEDEGEAFFRTIRLYDHGDNNKLDKIFENFYMAKDADGNLPQGANVRVNPLSSVAPIIHCALDRVPFNYQRADVVRNLTKQNFTEGLLKNAWPGFVDQWATLFTNEVKIAGLNSGFQKTIADFYGDAARMGWYSNEKETRQVIFKGYNAQVPLFEIDRKMMYSFSLDSMSDRQQLFLYIFQAESIAPISFADMRSLSGGRAVALVWRDPYPKGSTPDNPAGLAGTWYDNSNAGGIKSYHEHKILFFKQLDN